MERREPLATLFDRFVEPLPLRSRGAFHWVSARDSRADGRRRTLVISAPSADRANALLAFARCRAAHDEVRHPCVPQVVDADFGAAQPWMAFECPALSDGIEFVRAMGESESRIPYRAADGFIASLRSALEAAHATRDASGNPRCLGRLSLGNILFDAEGRWYIVGFGANLPVEKDNGNVDGSVVFFQPPELYGGGAATPVGDYVALLHFRRSVVPYVEIPPSLARILRGEIHPDDAQLLQDLLWTEQRLIGAMPHDRPTMAEAIEVAERIRRALGSERDEEGMRAFVAKLLEEAEVTASAAHDERVHEQRATEARAIRVGPECAWVATDGNKQRLGTALRRILQALVTKHRSQPGAPLTVWELLSAGWPGEDPIPEAGANRVYVTLNRLRSLGLRSYVERFDDGYRLAPDCVVEG